MTPKKINPCKSIIYKGIGGVGETSIFLTL